MSQRDLHTVLAFIVIPILLVLVIVMGILG
jgi:hypothetical protein